MNLSRFRSTSLDLRGAYRRTLVGQLQDESGQIYDTALTLAQESEPPPIEDPEDPGVHLYPHLIPQEVTANGGTLTLDLRKYVNVNLAVTENTLLTMPLLSAGISGSISVRGEGLRLDHDWQRYGGNVAAVNDDSVLSYYFDGHKLVVVTWEP